MMTLLISAHPWEGSFNHALVDALTHKLQRENRAFTHIDLHKDQFNPAMSQADLALYAKGEFADPLVGHYQELLKQADEVVFLFPIWWSTMPAILKGFFDKVLLVNFSHNYENGWTPLLTHIKKTFVVTTSQSPTAQFEKAIKEVFIGGSLLAVGFQNPVWLNCDNASHGDAAHRQNFIQKVVEAI